MPDLSLQDMLKIMDVAREMRQDRELVREELSHEERVSRLRERLLASTELTGETATPEEVDAAIELYFDNLHTFREPSLSVQTFLAHLYIRRWTLLFASALLLLVCGGIWSLFISPRAPLSPVAQRTARVAHQQRDLAQLVAAVQELSSEPEVQEQVEALSRTASIALKQSNTAEFDNAIRALTELDQQLRAAYEVQIVQSGQSAARRDYTDESGTRVSGYYVIVEALDAQGRQVTLPIANRETGKTTQATQWGEQVPEAVYERLKADKLADGVLDHRSFARKSRGQLDWSIQLRDAAGQPLTRGGQIISW